MTLELPARTIPVPPTLSPEAQAALAAPWAKRERTEPQPDDKAAWRAYIAELDANMTAMFGPLEQRLPARIETRALSRAPVYEITPPGAAEANPRRAILFLHGGAFITGGGRNAALMALPIAAAARCRTFAPDYRMPVDHPFPAGLDDACEAYADLLKDYAPEHIAVAGASAGGGLAAAMLLKARDQGLPLPAAAILNTPEVDLTESGDSFETNRLVDRALISRLSRSIALYADGRDLRDPYLSPLFGDFTRGFPPTLLTTGTRDLFLSNTVLMHRALRRAGVEAELHVFEAMPHGGFGGAPEDAELLAEQARFIDRRLER